MIQILVALLVLVVVGTLLWKVMSAQAAQAGHDVGRGLGEDPPTGPTRAARPRRPQRLRMVAPDDDPEFLRSLDERIQREDPPSSAS